MSAVDDLLNPAYKGTVALNGDSILPVDPMPATIECGQSPVAIDWGYLNAAQTKKLPSWEVFMPQGAVLGG
jgi:putative spermidine/putrescine transport system substrate-binding protein